MKTRLIFSAFFFLIATTYCSAAMGKGEVIHREAKNTLTPIEMNVEDIVKFKLRNGQVRTIVLEETDAKVIITNLNQLLTDQDGGGTMYHFTCKISVDGHVMEMERYVGSQESFYEPYVINGMRIWFDGVSDIFDKGIVNEEHGDCRPTKDARFAIADMNDKISPMELSPFYINNENFIDVKNSYNGDDMWMGAYNGFEAHGGLDINMPTGTPNFTPFPIDDHYFFNSLAKGDNNNRWRGFHKWDNGDVWTIQNHHMLNLRVPEHVPIDAGVHYADAAGIHTGKHKHSHYIFKVKTPEDNNEILLDPWILFWQIFEDNKQRLGKIKASIATLGPGNTKSPVSFSSAGSNPGNSRNNLSYYWTFGDGSWSDDANPGHQYLKPGIYPVTLVVDDGAQKDSFTQHITIDGNQIDEPGFALFAEDELAFRIRPKHIMDVYGVPVQYLPHSLHFLARESRPVPNSKIVQVLNIGGGTLEQIESPEIFYNEGKDWMTVLSEGSGNDQQLEISVNGSGLLPGVYSAKVLVNCRGAINNIQGFLVEITIPTYPPSDKEVGNLDKTIIDNSNTTFQRFYKTPYFWVMPQFERWKEKGYKDSFYLTNGGRDSKGEFARYTPDLEAGKYEIALMEETPYEPRRRASSDKGQQPVNDKLNPESRFAVRVKSKGQKENIVWVEPSKSRSIGIFEFDEGMDGFVEILSEGSTGQVLVDAIVFKKVE